MQIRLAEQADAPGIRAIYAPVVEHTVISFEADPPSEAEVADRVADTLAEYPWLVCEIGGDEPGVDEDGRNAGSGRGEDDRGAESGDDEDDRNAEPEIAGYAYAGRHRKRDGYRWSVDVSVYVAERHRRKGVARGLYQSLFEVLRLQGFHNAYAGIALPNEASVGLHESLGFEPVGVYESVGYKRGAWRDVGWWQLALRDRSERPASHPPDEPRPLPEVLGTPAFETAVSAGEPAVEP
ncbi:GNAT family N-acetyltransferase [Halorussus sp. AFM4]|uniref:GNAT family N-acetyltransferase n=1 Tax=Halorussus sp. AFM4 TaxID=3421651 RepID=UPI003EB81BA4